MTQKTVPVVSTQLETLDEIIFLQITLPSLHFIIWIQKINLRRINTFQFSLNPYSWKTHLLSN